MSIVYRHLRPLVFDENLCEIIPASRGGVSFKFHIDYLLKTLTFSYTRCDDSDNFNSKIAKRILDGRFATYDNNYIILYNEDLDLLTHITEVLPECKTMNLSEMRELVKHTNTIINKNTRVSNRTLSIVRKLSDKVLDEMIAQDKLEKLYLN